MATRKAFLARVEALGLELVEEDSIELLCPRGKRLGGLDVHMLRITPNPSWTRAAIYDAFLSDLAAGLEDCPDPDCDYCTEEED